MIQYKVPISKMPRPLAITGDGSHTQADFPTRTPIHAPGKAKPIGYVVSDMFVKHVSGRKHFLRVPPAIAFDAPTLDDAERAGATMVCIHDQDTGAVYRAPVHLIRSKGFAFDRGHGRQIALTLDRWSRNGAVSEAERRTEAQTIRAEAAAMRQLDLFGGGQ